jgi:O-antigen/teichoic acid export membrane protein
VRRLLLNTGSNYAILVVRIGVTFLLTPLYVKYLGVYNFGIWELVVATLGYTGMLDLGLGFSMSRFMAKYRAERDHHALLMVFNTVTAFLSSIGGVLAIVTLCLAVWNPGVLAPQPGQEYSYSLFLAIIAIQVFISFPGIVALGCLEGYQQYYTINFLTFIDTFIVLTITLSFIAKTNALVLLAGLSTFSLVWKYAAYLVILRRDPEYPLYFGRRYLSWDKLRSLLGFGIKGFIQGISNRIQSRSGVFIIGIFLGAASVPLFTVPANLASYLGNVTETGSTPFLPLFSALEAQGRREEILPMYLFASKLLLAVIVLISVGLLLLGPDFITLWVGPRFRASAAELLPYMVVAAIIAYMNPFGARFLMALGRHGIYAKVAPVALALNLLIAVTLVERVGMVGIVVGTIVAMLLVQTIALRMCCKLLRVSVTRYLDRALLPLVVPAIVMSATVLAVKHFVLIRNIPQVFAIAVAGTVIYCAAFLALGLSRSERGELFRLFARRPALRSGAG